MLICVSGCQHITSCADALYQIEGPKRSHRQVRGQMVGLRTSVESILTYGCEAWTLTVRDESRLDGCYTHTLRKVLNITWQDRISNKVLYGVLPPLSTKIRTRRLRLAGHCVRHDDVAAHGLVLWEPQQGRASRGGQQCTFIDTLIRDTGLQSTSEIRTLMLDRPMMRT